MAKKQVMAYEWKGSVLVVTNRDNEKLVKEYDFDSVPTALDENFLQIGRRTKLGNFATEAEGWKDKIAKMDAGFDLLCSGKWEFEGRGSGPTVSIEAEALANLKQISVAVAQKALRALKEADLEKYDRLILGEKMQKAMAEVRVQRGLEAEDAPDLDDLLNDE